MRGAAHQYRPRPNSRTIRPNGHHTTTIRIQMPIVPRNDFLRRIHTTQPINEHRTTNLTKPRPSPPTIRPVNAPATIETAVTTISRSKLRGGGVGWVALVTTSETRGDAYGLVSGSDTGHLGPRAAKTCIRLDTSGEALQWARRRTSGRACPRRGSRRRRKRLPDRDGEGGPDCQSGRNGLQNHPINARETNRGGPRGETRRRVAIRQR